MKIVFYTDHSRSMTADSGGMGRDSMRTKHGL